MRDSETTLNFLAIKTKLIFVAQTTWIWQAKMRKHCFFKSSKKNDKIDSLFLHGLLFDGKTRYVTAPPLTRQYQLRHGMTTVKFDQQFSLL